MLLQNLREEICGKTRYAVTHIPNGPDPGSSRY